MMPTPCRVTETTGGGQQPQNTDHISTFRHIECRRTGTIQTTRLMKSSYGVSRHDQSWQLPVLARCPSLFITAHPRRVLNSTETAEAVHIISSAWPR